jgi:hypothetical protein
MIRIHASDDRFLIAQLSDLLKANGIPILVRNEFLQGAAGELPVNECWPELWVMDAHMAGRARDLVKDYLDALEQPVRSWICRRCGESIEGQFGCCWRCGGPAPKSGDPESHVD